MSHRGPSFDLNFSFRPDGVSGILIQIFDTIVVHEPRACLDLSPMSYLQGQGNSAHVAKICVRAINPYFDIGFQSNFTQLFSVNQWFDLL